MRQLSYIAFNLILSSALLSCSGEVTDLRSSNLTSSNTSKDGDIKSETKESGLEFSWDSSPSDTISSYSIYAGLKELSLPLQKIKTVAVSEIPSFDPNFPKVLIPLELIKDLKGKGEVCFKITAENDAGESERSNEACYTP